MFVIFIIIIIIFIIEYSSLLIIFIIIIFSTLFIHLHHYQLFILMHYLHHYQLIIIHHYHFLYHHSRLKPNLTISDIIVIMTIIINQNNNMAFEKRIIFCETCMLVLMCGIACWMLDCNCMRVHYIDYSSQHVLNIYNMYAWIPAYITYPINESILLSV